MKKIRFLRMFLLMIMLVGSIKVYASDFTQWKQGNSAWGSKKLGNLCTMSDSGCLVTSIAIQMARSGVENTSTFNPGVLRDRLESGGFISHAATIAADGNLNTSAAFSQSNSPNFYLAGSSNFHPTPFSQIYSTLSSKLGEGLYAVVNVNYGGHWVAIASCSGGEVYINDPGSARTTLSSYNGGIESAIYFKAKANTTHDPQGYFDSITSDSIGTITIRGWAFDRDDLSKALTIHVYVGGPAGSGAPSYEITANKLRTDVNTVFPGVGNNHGYSETIRVSKTGSQTVYIYAINTGGGTNNPLIGTKTVTIKSDTEAPKISNVRISNITSSGYTVSCTVTDNVGVTSVKFPTWTAKIVNGTDQDDLVWHIGNISGNTASYTVKISDHKKERGTYITDIYAYDAAGNSSTARTGATVPETSSAATDKLSAPSVRMKATYTDRVVLTWPSVSGAKQYEIYVVSNGKKKLKATITATSCTYKNLKPGRSYTLYVRAKSGSAVSEYGQVKVITRPAKVTLKSVSMSILKYVKGKWSSSYGADGYNYWISDNAAFKNPMKYNVTKSKTSSSISGNKLGLTKGKKYYYKVRPFKKLGNTKYMGAWSSIKPFIAK